MKTKLEMAHECALAYIKYSDGKTHYKDVVEFAWRYADAMQAEADKREKEEQSEHVFEAIEEWQPDWSQAPAWANWWAMDENKNTRWIYSQLEQPYISDIFLRWCAVGMFDSADAPSFGYTGDWRESLRKRPQ